MLLTPNVAKELTEKSIQKIIKRKIKIINRMIKYSAENGIQYTEYAEPIFNVALAISKHFELMGFIVQFETDDKINWIKIVWKCDLDFE